MMRDGMRERDHDGIGDAGLRDAGCGEEASGGVLKMRECRLVVIRVEFASVRYLKYGTMGTYGWPLTLVD